MTKIPGRVYAKRGTKRHCVDCANFRWADELTAKVGNPQQPAKCKLLDMDLKLTSRICAHFELSSWITPTREEDEARTNPSYIPPRWSGDTFEDTGEMITYEGSADFASLKIIENNVRRLCRDVYKCEPNIFSCGCPETRLCYGACKCPKCGESVCFCELP